MNKIENYLESKWTLEVLINAFPKHLANDVRIVYKSFEKQTKYSWTVRFHSIGDEKVYNFSTGEKITVPYRLYFKDTLSEEKQKELTPVQKDIYHCIFTLCNDGYVREKHIIALLENDNIAEWVYPFILKNSSEYVVEILTTIYNNLKDRDNTEFKDFCKKNLQVFLYCHARMVSYWDCFYKRDYFRYEKYVGNKLFEECFGYSRCMEKRREKKATFLPEHNMRNRVLMRVDSWLLGRRINKIRG